MALETSMDRSFLQRLSSLLDEHLGEEQFGVKELAREIGLSKSQLLRKLQALKGKSTSQFIREYRLEKAMELLQQGAGTASEIAYRVGFSSPTYFSTCFHEYFGYPPGEVRYRNNGTQQTAGTPGPFPVSRKRKQRLVWLFVLGVLLVVATSFMVYLGSKNSQTSIAATTNSADVPKVEKSIAVLPFTNLSGDPKFEYISDGMTDEIISRLSEIKNFKKVVPFTTMQSYKNTNKSIIEIAKELGITHLLEGNVQKAGDTVKVVLRLIDGTDDSYDWADAYTVAWEMDELFRMQADIAENVAKNMGLEFHSEGSAVDDRPTDNAMAFAYYHQAKFQQNKTNKTGFDQAQEFFEKAIQLDPSYADAYAGLGILLQYRVWLGYHEVGEAARLSKSALHNLRKAIKLDPDNKVLVFYYNLCFEYEWDFDTVEPAFQRYVKAGELHNRAYGLLGYAVKTNRHALVLQLLDKIIPDDQCTPAYYAHKLQTLWLNGLYDQCERAISEEGPLFQDNGYSIEAAKFYIDRKDYEKARFFTQKMMLTDSSWPYEKINHRWLNAVLGSVSVQKESPIPQISNLIEAHNEDPHGFPAWYIALYYAHSRNYQQTFEWLQKSYERHEVEMTRLYAEPLLEPLKDDPRYKELLHKVGFSKVIPIASKT